MRAYAAFTIEFYFTSGHEDKASFAILRALISIVSRPCPYQRILRNRVILSMARKVNEITLIILGKV